MQDKEILKIPLPSLRRLPLYYNFLKEVEQKGIETISGPNIAEALHFIPIQVRKDLAYTGAIGKPKTGYVVKDLLKAIEHFLGWNNIYDAVLVGAGDLGRALMGYGAFKTYGLNIVMAFDKDPAKIGKKFHGKEVYSIDMLPHYCNRIAVKTGIITVPAENAQEVADRMVKSGIIAIWNFAPAILQLPANVIFQQADMGITLSILKKKLKDRLSS